MRIILIRRREIVWRIQASFQLIPDWDNWTSGRKLIKYLLLIRFTTSYLPNSVGGWNFISSTQHKGLINWNGFPYSGTFQERRREFSGYQHFDDRREEFNTEHFVSEAIEFYVYLLKKVGFVFLDMRIGEDRNYLIANRYCPFPRRHNPEWK